MALSHFLASERRGSNTTRRLTAARGTFRVQLPVLWCKDGGWIHMKHLRESRINTAASPETQLPLMAKAKLTNRENSVWKQEKWVWKDQSTHSPRKQSSEERQTEALQPKSAKPLLCSCGGGHRHEGLGCGSFQHQHSESPSPQRLLSVSWFCVHRCQPQPATVLSRNPAESEHPHPSGAQESHSTQEEGV